MLDSKVLWKETPLVYSTRLSEITGVSVYLKLENLHPSFSFKYRGISHFIQKIKKNRGFNVHLVIASSGNAGLAAACVARALELKCTVLLPTGAAESTLELLKRENAQVVVVGRFYAEALKAAKEMVAADPEAVSVPSYDHPLLWGGHSSMIHEIKKQLGRQPDAIFCSVGGGGLLGGVLEGCKAVGWDQVRIVALETTGSDCFYWSMSLNGNRFNSIEKTLPVGVNLVHSPEYGLDLAHFTSFSSKASGSLGASEPAVRVLKTALEWPGGVKTVSVPDELSMETLVAFTNDHRFLVELACSTALCPAYHPTLFDKLVGHNAKGTNGGNRVSVVFIVDGGFKIDLKTLADYQRITEKHARGAGQTWSVKVDDGQLFTFSK